MSIYYKVVGEGFPVVMIHGWTLNHQMLLHALEPVFGRRSGWKRIYIDLPGMGRSQPDPSIHNSDEMLGAVLNLLDHLIPNEPFIVCGNSYGGYLARGIAHFRRNLVRGLLLIAPMVVADSAKRVLPPRRILKSDSALISRLPLEDAAQFVSIAVLQGQAEWERFREEILIPSKCTSYEFLDRIRQNGYGFAFDMDESEAPFQYPVLIMAGRQDDVVGYQDAWQIMESYPRATFAVLDMAGHNLHIEQTDIFEALVHNWLDRMESGLVEE